MSIDLKIVTGRPNDKELYNIPARQIRTEKTHTFMVRTFSEPTQCAICYSYMLGLWRQGKSQKDSLNAFN